MEHIGKFRAGGHLLAGLLVTTALVGALPSESSAGDATLAISAGAFTLDLPSMQFVAVQDDDAIVGTVGRETNFDGQVNGSRFDAALEVPAYEAGAFAVRAGISGFYGSASGSRTTDCVDTSLVYCYVPMIVDDPDRGEGLFTTTEGEIFRTDADRDVAAWGIAVKAILGSAAAGGVEFTGGADFRRIAQSARLHSVYIGDDPEAPDELYSTYDETLNTDYLGAFVGLRGTAALWTNAALIVDGQVGAYNASADYDGAELQVYTGTPDDYYTASLSRQQFAVVASARAELRQQFGRLSLGLYNQFEWYSWAPRMIYNDHDVAGSDVYPGQQSGTVIGDGSIWSNTFGVTAAIGF